MGWNSYRQLETSTILLRSIVQVGWLEPGYSNNRIILRCINGNIRIHQWDRSVVYLPYTYNNYKVKIL